MTDLFNQIDGYNFDDYFNALISPVSENTKRQEIPSNIDVKYIIPKVEQVTLPMHQNLINGAVNINGMMMVPLNQLSGYAPIKPTIKKSKTKKRKTAESKTVITTSSESLEDEIPASPTKKNKKNPKGAPKKKKEAPNRKRINYCFEIHRSGCLQNKSSKLYCKVFLKGKLQSEVDLIKGARGKWAYTFYDQRKKKKERRYWPSQSSGPVIEDPCNCDKCSPYNITQVVSNDEELSSSPSTEEVEYDIIPPTQQFIPQMQLIRSQQTEYQQMPTQYIDQQNQLVYYVPTAYYPNDFQEYNQQYMKNMIKSSNDFQYDRNNQYLKSSNDFMANHQRQWENYFQANTEYNQDGFLENNFL